MIKKYIIGNKERGSEVIKELEKLGGVNINNYYGNYTSCLYFIGKNDAILNCVETSALADVIINCFEEIKLPEKKPKLKVIKGDKNRKDEIIELLKSMGGTNKYYHTGQNNNSYYFIIDNCIRCMLICDDFFNDFELEIMTLPEKKPTLKVIKGNAGRGYEIFKLLKSMGGENVAGHSCTYETFYYFINDKGHIDCHLIDSEFFKDYELEVLDLSKKKPVLKVIRGNENNGDEVIKTLENLGGINKYSYKGNITTFYYYISGTIIKCENINANFFNDYEIIELPEKKEHTFRPFEKVLVRDSKNYIWVCTLFSHIDNEFFNKFVCGGCHWKYCIPYEGNEHLAGTKDNPK